MTLTRRADTLTGKLSKSRRKKVQQIMLALEQQRREYIPYLHMHMQRCFNENIAILANSQLIQTYVVLSIHAWMQFKGSYIFYDAHTYTHICRIFQTHTATALLMWHYRSKFLPKCFSLFSLCVLIAIKSRIICIYTFVTLTSSSTISTGLKFILIVE